MCKCLISCEQSRRFIWPAVWFCRSQSRKLAEQWSTSNKLPSQRCLLLLAITVDWMVDCDSPVWKWPTLYAGEEQFSGALELLGNFKQCFWPLLKKRKRSIANESLGRLVKSARKFFFRSFVGSSKFELQILKLVRKIQSSVIIYKTKSITPLSPRRKTTALRTNAFLKFRIWMPSKFFNFDDWWFVSSLESRVWSVKKFWVKTFELFRMSIESIGQKIK